jgi:Glycosyl hydrolase family 79 C-terminal beta domain
MTHLPVVTMANFQNPSEVVDLISPYKLPLVMTEFNSASCGGFPGISNTFAVGSLWSADYALQLASVGFSNAYLHTREPGISYNVMTPPSPAGGPGPWQTGPPYYAILAVAEALNGGQGSKVVDLNISGGMTNASVSVAGYAVYDADSSNVNRLALFNTGNDTVAFTLPADLSSEGANGEVTIKYLQAASSTTNTSIAWGGETLENVADGNLIPATQPWVTQNQIVDCSNGCSLNVSALTMALVFVGQ